MIPLDLLPSVGASLRYDSPHGPLLPASLDIKKDTAMQPPIAHQVVGEHARADLASMPDRNHSTIDQTNQLPAEWDEQRFVVLAIMPTVAACAELVSRLEDADFGLCTACTTRKALELAEQALVDVVMLDLDGHYEAGTDGKMISGFRLLHLLWRLICGRPVALVVVSALDYTEVEDAVRASADDFINKPIGTAQLTSRLRGALGRVRARHQQTTAGTVHRQQVDRWMG